MSKVTICSVLLLFLSGTVVADQVTLDAVKDAGYFAAVDNGEILPTPNNLGGHTHIPVGSANNERLNRGLVEFDLSSIPSGVTVTSVSFNFEVTLQGGKNGQAGVDFGLYRVTAAWDEGTGVSNIGDPEGGPVNWIMRTAADPWTTLGGDFDPMDLGVVFVDGPSNYSISTSDLVAAIQDIVDGNESNFGFLLKGSPEGVLGSAARVSTREGGNAAQLVVAYTDGDFILGDVNMDGMVNLLDVAPFVEVLVGGGFSCEADANQDGMVDLLDVAPFIDLISGG